MFWTYLICLPPSTPSSLMIFVVIVIISKLSALAKWEMNCCTFRNNNYCKTCFQQRPRTSSLEKVLARRRNTVNNRNIPDAGDQRTILDFTVQVSLFNREQSCCWGDGTCLFNTRHFVQITYRCHCWGLQFSFIFNTQYISKFHLNLDVEDLLENWRGMVV